MTDSAVQHTRADTRDGAPPVISVVTPSLNQRHRLETTMHSVLDQDYPALEYVVVDGGSTDGSTDAIRAREARLAGWVSEPDDGHADAVNKGFARTSGDIMCWINSSDVQYPWTLRTVAQIFTDLPHVEWIMGLPSLLGETDGPKWVRRDVFNEYDFLAGNYHAIQQESVFWRRSLWERAGGALDQRQGPAADFDLWLRFFDHARLYHVDTVLAGFRLHKQRLGAYEEYAGHTARLVSQFAARRDRRTLRRAALIRALAPRQERNLLLSRSLRKLGLCAWYRHPAVVYDFASQKWTVA